ncbi:MULTISPECIES: recombinase RecT [Tsukamurella]|uniref:Recombinase RecT n=2 Tax=Tsukamurella TaxID=2060 RepID=A0A5C5S4U1_9ACTN|nr:MULTISPECIES: recombinase RecT [Tsukamurella]NMD55218.1 recombinase RecT [Tsukamurella columbiensis]TWS30239.1 recombinase RecT [Tsukamurella conjunctivitidis]
MSTTALATTNRSKLAITPQQREFTPEQREHLKQLGIDDAPDADLAVFFHYCANTQLDPFLKQIYMIGRRTKVGGYRGEPERWETKYTIQVGIDGFRILGNRIAKAQGRGYPVPRHEYCGFDGEWRDVWLDPSQPPAAAKGIVTVDGIEFAAVVAFSERAQTRNTQNGQALTGQWATQPAWMLSKCAEAAAWRMAFPADMGGIFEDAEVPEVVDGEVESPKQASTPEQVASNTAAAALTEAEIDDVLKQIEQCTTVDQLNGYVKEVAPRLPHPNSNRTKQVKAATAARREALTDPPAEDAPAPAPADEPVDTEAVDQ